MANQEIINMLEGGGCPMVEHLLSISKAQGSSPALSLSPNEQNQGTCSGFLYLKPTNWAIGSSNHPPIHPSFSPSLSPFIPLSLHPQSSPQEEAIGSGCMSGSLVRVSFLVGIMLRDPPRLT